MPIIVRSDGVSKDHDRERGGGLIPARAPEAIAESGEQERRGFTGNAGESQQNGSQDAAIGGGHDDGDDGFPLTGAEGHGGFAKGAWNGAKKFFGAEEGDGNQQQADGEIASEGGEMLERQEEKNVSKNTDDEEWNAVEEDI